MIRTQKNEIKNRKQYKNSMKPKVSSSWRFFKNDKTLARLKEKKKKIQITKIRNERWYYDQCHRNKMNFKRTLWNCIATNRIIYKKWLIPRNIQSSKT